MRRYFTSLLVLTLLMVLAAFGVMWFAPQWFVVAMPLLALYFGVVTGLVHYIVVRAMDRSPRAFVQVFLGSTVGMLILHMAVIAVYLVTNHTTGRRFLIAFLVGFVVSFAFEIVCLVRHVDNERKRRSKTENGELRTEN